MEAQQAELIPTRPGARLRHAREARGLTIQQVATKTHIRERILQAIERDDTDAIAPVYLRGYVKAYALGLGLDPAELEAEARATAGADPELRSVFNVERRRGFAERWLKAGSYAVASVLIAALVWQVTQQAVQFSEGRATLLSTEPPPVSSAPPDVNGQSGTTSRQSTHLAASIASLERLKDRPPSTESAARQAWSAIKAPAQEAEAGPAPAAVPEGQATIAIRVSADSWVEITDGSGRQIEMDLLRGGNSRNYQGVPPFELMLGRASAVELQYNGAAVDLEPHIRDNVARMTLGEAEQETP
jgi:cytoskeleton protein RodZ